MTTQIVVNATGKEIGRSPDCSELLTRAFEIKAYDDERRTADFVASTAAVDSHGEVIDQASWQLGDFLRNPVILFAHQSRELPIGRATSVGVVNGQLECRIEFATAEMNPRAEQVWKMVQAKFLRAVSVGFMPTNGRYEVRDGNEVFVWSGCVLKEISVTPVGANQDALAKMKALFGAPSDTPTNPPPASPGGDAEGKGADMDLKEALEMIDKQAGALGALKLESEKAIDAEKARAEKAEKAALDAEAQVKALTTEKAAFEAQTKALLERAEKAEGERDALEAKNIEHEVEALVNKKISPAEKPVYVELRKSNPALFAKMIEQRQEMRLEEQVVPSETTNSTSVDELIAELNGGV